MNYDDALPLAKLPSLAKEHHIAVVSVGKALQVRAEDVFTNTYLVGR